MKRIGVFVGSTALEIKDVEPCGQLSTPWGDASCEPVRHRLGEHELVLMPRHGANHEYAPHQINYRANVSLMHALDVDGIIGTYTVGSVDPELRVEQLVAPHQLIDYTWGRESTYDDELRHVVFSNPFDAKLRGLLLDAEPAIVDGGVYACTQGPRLETAAEIARLHRDGCTLVGMTGMPEAALARELNIPFASLCLVVNPGAGLSDEEIDMNEIKRISAAGAVQMIAVLRALLSRIV